MKNHSWLLLSVILLAGAFTARSQQTCTTQPGFICITQASGNVAAQDHRTVAAQDEEIAVLKASLLEKDKNVDEVKKTAAANEADLKAQNTKLLVDVAQKTGEIIKCDAETVRDSALIEYLVKNQRSKQQGVINIKLGGN